MKTYSYSGYANKQKMDKAIPLLVFMLIVVIGGIIGLLTDHPYFICAIILYPVVNYMLSEKSIPCNVTVHISDTKVQFIYKDVQRGDVLKDEIYEYTYNRIRRVHWIKEQKRLGIYGYPVITYSDKIGNKIVLDCKKDKKRKRIYVSYPYEELYGKLEEKIS